MAIFRKHYLAAGDEERAALPDDAVSDGPRPRFDEAAYMRELQQIICDEKAIETGHDA